MVRILLELIYPMYNHDRNFIHKLLLKGFVLDQMGTLTLKKFGIVERKDSFNKARN